MFRWLTGETSAPLFKRPYGVAWYGEDLLVTDPGAQQVLKISPDGRVVTSAASVVEDPIGVAVCLGAILVTEGRTGRVALLDRDLRRVKWLAEDLDRPTGITCAGEKAVVVETGAHRLAIFGRDGSRTNLGERGVSLGQFNFPTSATVSTDSPSAVWVGDTLNFRVQKLGFDGGSLRVFGTAGDSPGDMPRIKGIAIDSDGDVWISDAQLDQVAIYSPTGEFLMDLGRTGIEPGEFRFPAGLASRGRRVAVADSLNARVQIFRVLTRDERNDIENKERRKPSR